MSRFGFKSKEKAWHCRFRVLLDLFFFLSVRGRKIRAENLQQLLRILAVFLLCLMHTNQGWTEEVQKLNLGTQVYFQMTGNGTPGPYQLKDQFILQETERIDINGRTMSREEDYVIDYDGGKVVFSETINSVDTLEISYKSLNLNLRRRYFHRELLFGEHLREKSTISFPVEPSENRSRSGKWKFLPRGASSDLNIWGSKTFSLEVGSSQDISLRQGLWLSANGNATEDLEISLQLSDQNMPATPEGSTKRLEELDKVQLKVRSTGFSGTLGDYYLRSSALGLTSYEKKLKGVTAQATTGQTSFSMSVASSEGEYSTNRLSGQDNMQGPYQLSGKNGETGIMVLPGTERVWLDGEQLERGSGSDYTIDYSKGTIEFTPRKLITSDSRITVDFEYSMENYQRDLYGGDFAGNLLGGRVSLKASGITERDNRNHPQAFVLSGEDRQILSLAGNDRMSASKEGASFEGEGRGEYDLEYDSSGHPYYQYVGSDSGSYKVSFSRVGEGKGSYQYVGGGVYRYVYPNNGSYSPVLLLPLPESHSLFDLNLSLLPWDALNTQIEWAKSRKDKNTFSSRDDEHNWGNAASFITTYQKNDFQLVKSNFHKLRLESKYRSIDSDFISFGRVNPVERERIWGLGEEIGANDQKTFQLNGLVAPWRSLSVSFDYGKLREGRTASASRTSVGMEVSPLSWILAKGKTERVKTKGTDQEENKGEIHWRRNSIFLNGYYRRLSTTFSWSRERRNSPVLGFNLDKDNFDQLTGEVSFGLFTAIKVGTELIYRQDVKTTNEGESKSYTWSNLLSMRDLKGVLSSDVEFTRRIRRYGNSDGQNSKQDLLVARVDFYPHSQLMNVNFYHSQNQIHSGRRVDSYLQVEEGRGDYIQEDGRYVPHPEGNFVRLSEWLGDVRPSLDVNKSIRLMFSPHKVSSKGKRGSLWPRIGKLFSMDSFINFHGRITEEQSLGSYLFYPLSQLSDDNILYQNLLVRHDLHLMPAHKSLGFRLRWEKTQEIDRLISETGRSESTLKQELLLKSHLGKAHLLECNLGREEIDEMREGVLGSSIRGRSYMLGITRMQAKILELKLSAEHKQREERIKQIGAHFFSLSPEFIWSLLSQGRLKVQFQWTNLKSTVENRSLPYVMTEGKAPGQNYDWGLLFDLKLNRHLISSIAYSGESVPSKPSKHTARVEVKAVF